MQLRQGATTGTRPTKAAPPLDISGLVHTSIHDCRSACFHATREQLIAAHRWCEASGGQKSRRAILARALRKRQINDDAAALMQRAAATAATLIKGDLRP